MTEPACVVVEPAPDKPILLIGPPRAIAADITLMNQGDRSVVLRDVGLRDRSGRLPKLPARHAVMTTVLRAGQQRALRIAFSLPPTTPAGEYAVELDILGEARQARLHVSEEVSLRVEPSTLWVENVPERGQSKRVTIVNAGNATAHLADLTDVPLRDDLAPPVDIGEAIRSLVEKRDFSADAVVEAIAPLRRGRVRLGSLSLAVPGGQVTIAPGETRSLEVGITLPDPPPPSGRARARVPLVNATLDVVVVPSGGAQVLRDHRDEPRTEKRNSKPPGATPRRKTRGRS